MAKRKVEIEITAKDKASKALKSLSKGALAGIGVAAGLAAANLAATLGRELIRTARLILEIGIGFEKSMSGVKAITRGTASEMAALEKVARNLGKSTVFTANEAAKAMEQFSLAGFSVNEVLSATPAALDLAAAGQLSMAEAADITSNVLRQFNIDASETARVVDVIAAAATTSNQTVRDLGAAMTFAGLTANQLGLSLEETASLLGKLADRGLKASLGGTALRRAFSVFMGQLEPGEEGLKGFNAALARNEDGSFSFAKALDQLRDSGMTTDDVMKAFGLRAGPAMNALLGLGGDAISDYTEKIKSMGGVAKQVGEDRLDNLGGDVTKLTSALTESAIEIFKSFNPALRALAQTATDAVREVNDAVEAAKALEFSYDAEPVNVYEERLRSLQEQFERNTKALVRMGNAHSTNVPVRLDQIKRLAEENVGLRDEMELLLRVQGDSIQAAKDERDASDSLTKSLEGQAEAREKNLLSSGEFQGPQNADRNFRFDGKEQGPPTELFDAFVDIEEAKRQQIQQTRDALLQATLAITTDAVMRRDLQLGILEEQYIQEQEQFAGNVDALENLRLAHIARKFEIEDEFRQAEADTVEETLEADLLAEEERFLLAQEMLGEQHEAIEALEKAHQARMQAIKDRIAIAEAKRDKDELKRKIHLTQNISDAVFAGLTAIFGESKTFSIGKVLMDTALGIMRTWAELGWPAAIPGTIMIAAAGLQAVKEISSAKFAHGGLVTGGVAGIDSVHALLTPGEVVIPEPIVRELNRVGGTRGGAVDTSGVFAAGGGGGGGGAGGNAFVLNINGGASDLDPEEVFGADMLREMAERLSEFVKLGGGELVASHLLQSGAPVTATDLQS